MFGNSQSEFTVKIHTFIPRNSSEKIPRNSKSHFAREGHSTTSSSICLRIFCYLSRKAQSCSCRENEWSKDWRHNYSLRRRSCVTCTRWSLNPLSYILFSDPCLPPRWRKIVTGLSREQGGERLSKPEAFPASLCTCLVPTSARPKLVHDAPDLGRAEEIMHSQQLP